jgi:hypothetical protein
MAYKSEMLTEKWDPILNNEEFGGTIKDSHRRDVTAILLENQVKALQEERQALNEAPVNVVGDYQQSNGAMAKFDPVLISLVRRTTPQLMAFDIAGVQPMTMPTGLVFAMRPRYVSAGAPGAEAWHPGEVDSAYSGEGTQLGSDPTAVASGTGDNTTGYTTGKAMPTADGELLGTGGGAGEWGEMAFTIERTDVSAKTRALRATYTVELQQDFKAVHGGDADAELGSILSTEIVAETNRELIRTIYTTALPGASAGTTAVAGTFDLDIDSNGRWSVERFKGLVYQIERDLNAIAQSTRFGKGNWVVTSADVASALAMIGVLDYTPALQANLQVDDTGNTFAGMLHGRVKVFIDPYSANFGAASQFYVAGYKGTNPYMAGIFYCPYVPLQMYRAVDPASFQPAMGFKTRYGLIANPFAGPTHSQAGVLQRNNNPFFRRTRVTNLM